MSERLADVQARLVSIRQLDAVVGAMRGIAGARAQQARAAVAGIRAYSKIVEDGLARAIDLLPADRAQAASGRQSVRPALVLFSAEHGFVGSFTERTLGMANQRDRPRPLLFLVGSRGSALAEERGWKVAWQTPMASQIGAVGATARQVADALYDRFSAGTLSTVDIGYARLGAAGHSELERSRLLPLDFALLRRGGESSSPLANLAPEILVERLVAEYVFAALAHATMESFASENAARLETMESARVHIEGKLTELGATERRLRQEQVTEELLDMITGTLAASPVERVLVD
jgi:F-type H+-transporting ATPase subunit gamma